VQAFPVSYKQGKLPFIFSILATDVVIRLYIELVEDALTGPGYAAELAGISYGLSSSMDGITAWVSGYNDKLLGVLTMVLECLRNLTITQDRFEIVMEKVSNHSHKSNLVFSHFDGICS
jgi:insulysin